MKRTFAFIGRFFADQWRQFNPTGQLFFVLAVAAIIVDASIAAKYGQSAFESLGHAAGFALVAIACALVPDVAAREFERKHWTSGCIMAAICIPIFGVAYQSHVGYGAGVRLGDMQAADVSAIRVADVRSSLDSERTNIAMWREQLAALKQQAGWSPTINAEAMRQRAEAESKRGGCGPKCLELKAQVANAEKVDDLTKRIEATQRIIDSKTQVAADTKPKASAVVFQNEALGDLLKLTGFEFSNRQVNLAATGNTALAFLLLAPLFMFAAGRNRVSPDPTHTARTVMATPAPAKADTAGESKPAIAMPRMLGTATLSRIAAA